MTGVSPAVPPQADDQRQRRILLVDDNALTRGMLRELLAGAGFAQVREAGDGESGLRLAAHFKPHLVCLDLFMPGLDGLQVLQRLRQDQPDAAVVMLTASGEREKVEACIRAGARGYLIKPYDAARIIATFERVLRS